LYGLDVIGQHRDAEINFPIFKMKDNLKEILECAIKYEMYGKYTANWSSYIIEFENASEYGKYIAKNIVKEKLYTLQEI
jgi:hypothetical protein